MIIQVKYILVNLKDNFYGSSNKEAIKSKMNRYLLTNMERLNEYLESINLAWCQEDKIIEEIKKRIKING